MRQAADRRTGTNEAAGSYLLPLLDRGIARDLAGELAGENRLNFARGLTYRAVTAYAASLRPVANLPPWPRELTSVPLTGAAEAAAFELGSGLAGIPEAEAAYLLGTVYTSTLPDDFRGRYGAFYTPPEIVQSVLEMAQRAGTNWRNARCLDPSAGGGAFIVGMILRIRTALSGTEPAFLLNQIAARVRGYDLDPFGAWLAQAAAQFAVRDLEAAAKRRFGQIIHVKDSLDIDDEDRGAFDVVASNVPFGRITLTLERRRVYARSTYGHANLYGLFADAGLSYASVRGIIAYVMPTSMLSGLYYKSLRTLLANEAPPHEITFVTERSGVFDDALQETMLATYRKGTHARSGKVNFLAIGGQRQMIATTAARFSLPSVKTAPWIVPRVEAHMRLAEALSAMPSRLSTYGYGVSTGPLVWNRHKPQFRQYWQIGALPVVWAESVTSDGRFIWRAERRGHVPWFAAQGARDDWLIVREPCVLLQRTTAKEQHRRLIAAEMPESFIASHGGGVIVENHLNMIRNVGNRPTVVPAVIAAVLNSRAADMAFRCMSGSVAVSAFELEELPFPDPDTMRLIALLLARGAPSEDVQATIASAYGV